MKRSTATVRLYTRAEGGSNERAQKQNRKGNSLRFVFVLGSFRFALRDVSALQESAVRTIRSQRRAEHNTDPDHEQYQVTAIIQDVDLTPWDTGLCNFFRFAKEDCLLVWRQRESSRR